MAFSPQDDDPILADINVTPLVDVMLVLLIIFMVAAPMMHQGIQVALPRAAGENLPAPEQDPLVLSINKEGIVYFRETPIHPSQLVERLLPIVQARETEGTVFIKADREVAYGQVMAVLEVLREGGMVNIGMVTDPPEERGGRSRR